MGWGRFFGVNFVVRKVGLGEAEATSIEAGVIGVKDEWAAAWSTLFAQTNLDRKYRLATVARKFSWLYILWLLPLKDKILESCSILLSQRKYV